MYRADEEIFAEVVSQVDVAIRDQPNFARVIATTSTLLAVHAEEVSAFDEVLLMTLCKKVGFEFATHDEVRMVSRLAQAFLEAKTVHLDERARAPLQAFDALFYRDRKGRLMARFSIGALVCNPVELVEEWEVKFVRAYHDALQQLLAAGPERTSADATEQQSEDPLAADDSNT